VLVASHNGTKQSMKKRSYKVETILKGSLNTLTFTLLGSESAKDQA
jgi:hypothetical protein